MTDPIQNANELIMGTAAGLLVGFFATQFRNITMTTVFMGVIVKIAKLLGVFQWSQLDTIDNKIEQAMELTNSNTKHFKAGFVAGLMMGCANGSK